MSSKELDTQVWGLAFQISWKVNEQKEFQPTKSYKKKKNTPAYYMNSLPKFNTILTYAHLQSCSKLLGLSWEDVRMK